MTSKDNEDLFEGDVGKRRPRSSQNNASLFRPPSAVNSKRVAKRQRAAWYNRALCMAWLGRNAEAVSCLDQATQLDLGADFEKSVAAWSLAEVLRQGAGAEPLADDLRFLWIVDWSDDADFGDAPKKLDPIGIGQAHVQDRHIRLMLLELFQCLGAS